MKTIKPVLLGLLSIALVACAAKEATVTTTSAKLPAPNANGEYRPPWPTMGRGIDGYITLQLGPDADAHCRNVSPKFPFDSATAYVEDKDQLSALAKCLNHPEMQGKGVLLVGRADPRGTDDYNLKLGEKRATEIRDYLVKEGLLPNRIAIESLGKRDAKGYLPDYSFGYDRRVDVVVVGDTHAPK